jgi:ribosomal protein S18 acetylase RimI-like enzyme
MEFLRSNFSDTQTIFTLYDAAIAHQKAVSDMHWLPFDKVLVVKEIEQGRQWKVIIDGAVACVFVVAYEDPAIWGTEDTRPAIYLHRIVTNPAFRGRNFVGEIIKWAREHCQENGIRLIRLDTWAENHKLREVYTRNGFRFLGDAPPADSTNLPSHYSGIILGFYEIYLG